VSRVLVIGAGAIGGTIGALLAETGHDVELRGRSAPVAGLRLTGGGYGPDRDVAFTTLRGPPDLVLAATKTQDLAAAMQQHRMHIGDAPIVALQNGLAQDDIVSRVRPVPPHLPVSPWAGAVVVLDAQMLDRATIGCARPGTLLLGGPAADVAEPILRTAVAVERTRDLVGARWTKLLVNLGNAIPAITGLSFQRTSRHKKLGRAHLALVREGLAVARAEGVALQPIPWTSPALMKMLSFAPDVLARPIYASRVRRVLGDAPAYGSTWQSLQRGGSLETEWLNGEIVRRGAARGIATPANEMACSLVEKRERMDADDAARALGVG
jgi:2-dehydropantoate 2-reductase